MPVVRCPQCNSQMMVESRDAGHEVECPVCMAAFIAPKEAIVPTDTPAERPRSSRRSSEESPRSRSRDDDDDDYDDRPRRSHRPKRRVRRRATANEIEDAQDAVRGPARGMILTAWIGLALHIVVGIGMLIGGMYVQQLPNMKPDDKEAAMVYVVLGPLCIIVSIPYCICMAIGAHKLLRVERLKSTGWVTTSAVMGIASIAFCGICSPVTWFGIPFGVWMITVLNNPEVRTVIESNALYPSENGNDAEF